MPKPGTTNTLLSPFKTPLTQLASGTTKPLTTIASTAPNMSTATGPVYAPPPTTQQTTVQKPAVQQAAPAQQQFAQPQPQQQQPVQQQPAQQQLPVVNPNQQFNQVGGAQPLAYNPTFSGLVGQLGQFPNPVGQQAQQQAGQSFDQVQKILGTLKESRDNQAKAIGEQGLAPIPMGDITGRQAVIRQQYETQQANLGSQAQALSNLYSPALSAATTGQGQHLQGIQTAAQQAAPNPTSFGQGTFNPLTGQIEGGGGNSALNPLNNVQSIAQQVISGQISPSQAYSMGGSVQNWQGVLNQAILGLNPAFNIAQAEGSYNARQQNTQTAGTAATNAYASAFQQNYPEYLQVGAQLQNVEALGSLLLRTGSGGQINPFDTKFANISLNQFRQQLSDVDQAKFNNTLAAYAAAASQLLGSSASVTPTQITEFTNGIIDGSLSMAALKAAYDQSLLEGRIKQTTSAGLVNVPGSQIGAPQVGSSNNPLSI